MFHDPATGTLRGGVAKTSYSHQAMAELILGNPAIDQNELAAHFGYTAGWVSQVIASDAFQAYLATRKEEIVDPVLRAAVEESFKGLVLQSISILRRKLEANPSDQLVLEVFKNSAKALGYGARPQAVVNVGGSLNLIGVLAQPPQERVVLDMPKTPAPA